MWGSPDKGHRTNILPASGIIPGASLVTQTVKNLPAMQETGAQSLDQEDPLNEDIATHSSILAWRFLRRSPAGYSPWGRKESDTTGRRTLSLITRHTEQK